MTTAMSRWAVPHERGAAVRGPRALLWPLSACGEDARLRRGCAGWPAWWPWSRPNRVGQDHADEHGRGPASGHRGNSRGSGGRPGPAAGPDRVCRPGRAAVAAAAGCRCPRRHRSLHEPCGFDDLVMAAERIGRLGIFGPGPRIRRPVWRTSEPRWPSPLVLAKRPELFLPR